MTVYLDNALHILPWWQETLNSPLRAQMMWETWDAPYRANSLTAALLSLETPPTSLYEVGCGSGPNLRWLQAHHPHLRLGGSEPCDAMAAYASDKLGLSIDIEPIPAVPRGTWDAVLFCYTLAYLDPMSVSSYLHALRDAPIRSLIILEPMTTGTIPSGQWTRDVDVTQTICRIPEWYHHYPEMLRDAGWEMTWRWPIRPLQQALNAGLVCERADRVYVEPDLPSHLFHIPVPVAARTVHAVSPCGVPAVAGTTHSH